MTLTDRDIRRIAVALADELHSRGVSAPAPVSVLDVGDVRFSIAMPEPASRGRYLYFVKCYSPDGHIKIGNAVDIARRINTMQIGCPYDLELLGYYWSERPSHDEAELHERFAAARFRGEWFRPTDAIVSLAGACRRARSEALASLLTERP